MRLLAGRAACGLSFLLSCTLQAAAPSAGHIDPAAMAKAFSASGRANPQALDAQSQKARDLAAKSLGDVHRDLVFVPVPPCTIWDTRFAQDPLSGGIIGNGVAKQFYSHEGDGTGSYTQWGGNTGCLDTRLSQLGVRPYAVMMTVYVSEATANGWLTFSATTDPDPSQATISVYYSPGPTRTQTVISKSGRDHGFNPGGYDVVARSRFGAAHAAASVVGYFLKAQNINLFTSTAVSGNILKGPDVFIHNFGDHENAFMGVGAGNFSLTGESNSAFGAHSMAGLSTGAQNTAAGFGALAGNSTGSGNVAVGYSALSGMTSGSGNIALGANAGSSVTAGSSNILVGHDGLAAESGTIRIGKSPTHARAFLAGVRGATTDLNDAVPVFIDSAGQLGTVSSSIAVKDRVADMGSASSDLMKLRPVTFEYRSDAGHRQQYGLIAEEVAQVYPGIVARTREGKAETVMYQYLPPMLLNEYQKQHKRIAELERERTAQAARIEALERAVAALARAP